MFYLYYIYGYNLVFINKNYVEVSFKLQPLIYKNILYYFLIFRLNILQNIHYELVCLIKIYLMNYFKSYKYIYHFIQIKIFLNFSNYSEDSLPHSMHKLF